MKIAKRRLLFCFVVLFGVLIVSLQGQPGSAGLKVNTRDRAEVVRFHKMYYEKQARVPNGWSGNLKLCTGTNSAAFREATRQRINYFRAMAGLPGNVQFEEQYNKLAQAAVIALAANGRLTHTLPPGWKCYSETAKQGAARSNLSYGNTGPMAVTTNMLDRGPHNKDVGHRRNLLYPTLAVAGSGATERHNAIMFGELQKEKVRVDFIAWPPAGFVPWRFGHSGRYRWSFQKDNFDLSQAKVRVFKKDGGAKRPLKIGIEYQTRGIVVWVVEMRGGPVKQDEHFEVSIQAGGQTFSYPVVFIDPRRPGGGKI